MRPALATAALACLLVPAALASTTRTKPAGSPPWYRGDLPAVQRLGWLPVRVEPGPPGTPEAWVPRASLERLAGVLTQILGTRSVPEPWIALPALPEDGAPLVVVACTLADGGPEECDVELRAMEWRVRGPSKAWRERAVSLLEAHDLDALVVPVLTITEQWPRQRNLKGSKEIVLGTGHARPLPWLTALDTPVEVVQLGGLLVGRDGQVARAGVEGLLAVRTGIAASGAGLQRTVSPAEIDALSDGARREDLAGAPRVTDAAVRTLLEQLLGPARSAPREP